MLIVIGFVGVLLTLLLILGAINGADPRTDSPAGTSIFCGIAAGVVGVLTLSCCLYASPRDTWYSEDEPAKTIEIASFANAQEVRGTGGFLAKTRIGEDTVYRYVQKHDNGQYTLEQLTLPASGSRIILGRDNEPVGGVVLEESATPETARIEFYTCKRADPLADFLRESCGELVIFHAPEGTVSQEFSLDPAAS